VTADPDARVPFWPACLPAAPAPRIRFRLTPRGEAALAEPPDPQSAPDVEAEPS
jgi:hypothetical protein